MTAATIDRQLKAAAARGHLDEVKRLIEAGADVDYHGENPPQSPLMDAYFNNHRDVIEYLVAQGADIDHDKFDEGTVLTFSAFGGHVDWIEYLLDLGADINHPMPVGGETALHHAADKDQVEAARVLVRRGGDVNLQVRLSSDCKEIFESFVISVASRDESLAGELARLVRRRVNDLESQETWIGIDECLHQCLRVAVIHSPECG